MEASGGVVEGYRSAQSPASTYLSSCYIEPGVGWTLWCPSVIPATQELRQEDLRSNWAAYQDSKALRMSLSGRVFAKHVQELGSIPITAKRKKEREARRDVCWPLTSQGTLHLSAAEMGGREEVSASGRGGVTVPLGCSVFLICHSKSAFMDFLKRWPCVVGG